MPSSNSIFISYRRSDSNDVVGRIYDRLQEYFGQDIVFKDVNSIPYGDDFRTHLVQTIGRCQVLVVVIGPTWLQTLQERLTKKGQQDWVRAEIETALNKEIAIPVIPLLVGGAYMPNENDLPESLKPLVHRNVAQARPDPDFHTDLDRLIRRLQEIVGVSESATLAQTNGSSMQPEPVATEIAEASRQSSGSQSFGNITISGSNNPFNAIQAAGDVNINQSHSQTKVTDPGLQAALETIKALKQAIATTCAVDDTEKAMVAIPIQKLESELQNPKPDQKAIERAIATIKKMLDGVTTLAEFVNKVAALTTNV